MQPTGYDPLDYYFATRYRQGGRWVYAMDLALPQLVGYLPKPDPDKPLETNRKINLTHARGFASYIREHAGWVSPALLLRAPDIFDFEIREEVSGTQFGVLGVPKNARSDIKIIDGQHRTLGVHLGLDQLSQDLEKARDSLAKAKKQEEPNLIQHFQESVDTLMAERERLSQDRLSVLIVVVEDVAEAKQIFVDIADNAMGITSAVRVRFDDRKIVNRVLEDAMEHAMLKDHVDVHQDRVRGASPYLLGAKHVADIVRALAVGKGRVGKRKEAELSESSLVESANEFFDAMLEAFPELADFADGALPAEDLRAQSILGSQVMLRAFAGAWYELAEDGWDAERITEALTEFAPHTAAPVWANPDDTWYATGLFPRSDRGAYGPTSRAQDVKALVDTIVDWCKKQPDWNRSEAAEEPAA